MIFNFARIHSVFSPVVLLSAVAGTRGWTYLTHEAGMRPFEVERWVKGVRLRFMAEPTESEFVVS